MDHLMTLLDVDRHTYFDRLSDTVWTACTTSEPVLASFADASALVAFFEPTASTATQKAEVFAALLRRASSPEGTEVATLVVMLMQPLALRLSSMAAQNRWDATAHDIQVLMWLEARQARPATWNAPLATFAQNVTRRLSDEWRTSSTVVPCDDEVLHRYVPAVDHDMDPATIDFADTLRLAQDAGVPAEDVNLIRLAGTQDVVRCHRGIAAQLNVSTRTVQRRLARALDATRVALAA